MDSFTPKRTLGIYQFNGSISLSKYFFRPGLSQILIPWRKKRTVWLMADINVAEEIKDAVKKHK